MVTILPKSISKCSIILFMAKRSQALSNTGYTILGILSFGEELSGYEIRKWAENIRFFYWSPAQSQIYSELQRLEEKELLLSYAVPQEGKPDKRLYRITDMGITQLQEWFSHEEVSATVVKHSVALKLYFGHMATPDILISILRRFIDETEEILEQLGVVQEYMENHLKIEYPALVAEWGYHYYDAELTMAKKSSNVWLIMKMSSKGFMS